MKNPKVLQKFMYCTSKWTVGNNLNACYFGKGAIEGATVMLMAQGATYEQAWKIVQEYLPNNMSPHAMPHGWKFSDTPVQIK